MRTETTTNTVIDVSTSIEFKGAIEHVCNELILNNVNVKIHLADGVYDTSDIFLRTWVGSHNGDFNNVEICGNPNNVDAVVLTAPSITIGSVSIATPWVLRDMTITSQANGVGIIADRLSQIFLAGKVKFSGPAVLHAKAQYNSMIEALAGSEIIVASSAVHFASTTSGSHFLTQSAQGNIPAPKITFTSGVNFNNGAFIAALDLGTCDVQSASWSGTFTGPKFYRRNGIIKHSNNIPGSSAGVSDGWQ